MALFAAILHFNNFLTDFTKLSCDTRIGILSEGN